MSKEDGGPDFGPVKYEPGLQITLRDHFATKAMEAVNWHEDESRMMFAADFCYKIADAMIKARKK